MSNLKPIKILECIRQGQIGGGESHLLSLIENLDRSEFDPVVLSFTDGPMVSRLEALGIRTKVISTLRPFDVSKWKLIKEWMRKEQFSLVHAHGTRANSNILWAARKLNIPVVYTIHGWSFHNDQPALIKKIRVLGERYLTSKSTINISVSQSNKETGEKHFRGFRSIVVNNGINQQKFNPNNIFNDIRKELHIPSQAKVVLFLARFTHQKQPLALLKAFLNIADTDKDLFLLMIGDGEQKEDALKIINTSVHKERIKILPFRQDVPDILSAVNIFTLGSLWEGLPIALLEAMAMGKTIIASNADGTKEIIVHKKNGYLVNVSSLQADLEKALIELSNNETLCREMQANALETVKNSFNAKQMTIQIQDVYKRALIN